MKLEIDKIYLVNHCGKGTFHMKVLATPHEWVDGVIVAGTANAILNESVKIISEKITVRKNFCTFKELKLI